jgi:hypothetical protein
MDDRWARNSPRPDHVEAHGNLAATVKKQGKRDAISYPGMRLPA